MLAAIVLLWWCGAPLAGAGFGPEEALRAHEEALAADRLTRKPRHATAAASLARDPRAAVECSAPGRRDNCGAVIAAAAADPFPPAAAAAASLVDAVAPRPVTAEDDGGDDGVDEAVRGLRQPEGGVRDRVEHVPPTLATLSPHLDAISTPSRV